LTNHTGISEFSNIRDAEPDQDGIIECALVPLSNLVVYPRIVTSISLSQPKALAAIQAAQRKKQTIIGVALRDPINPDSTISNLYSIGAEMALGSQLPMLDGSLNVLVQGRQRVEITSVVRSAPYMIVKARPLAEFTEQSEDAIDALMQTAVEMFSQVADMSPRISDDVQVFALNIDNPGWLADVIASSLTLSLEERQMLIETLDTGQRLERVITLLDQELRILELKDEINSQVQQEMDRSQREVFLREQMRVIQSELGEGDFYQQELDEVREQITQAQFPAEIRERAYKELSRLAMMPPMAPEVGIIRTYIDWLTGLPWAKESEDNLDLTHAQRVLDAEHYGLPKIKDRILEYIAVRKLAANKMSSPILCFVGPPGVGKTSLGKSIANSLGREFVRVSLGGVHDEAEIRGHRRTYIGALPGRIIQTMRRAGTINPVFILDEIDKLGVDFRGDPAASLLEVLDPEQNSAYSDHYLDVSYDLSKVLFITTANDLFPIPPALLDRLEILEFPGYTEEEKLEISRRFLIPKQMEAHGLTGVKPTFETRALKTLIREYTYEAGVRNLNREIANVARKVARLVAEEKPYPARITARRVYDYLGPPYYMTSPLIDTDSVGIATGLVWSSGGGDIQIIEVSVLPGKGTLMMTGQLGEVLQESAQAALSYMRSRADEFDVPHDDFENYDVHVHMPEGSVPKDGPSAGITLATAIISAFTERKIRSNFAMTGEITLRGKVLPVGGIKEKVLAARRARIKNVILPSQNRKDLVDIPAESLHDLNIIFVDNMKQVVDRVLLQTPSGGRQRDLNREEKEAASAT
jgi:ATP-dependent Lon protease